MNDIDLFFESIVNSYVKSPRFFSRHWLANEVNEQMERDECRFVLITTEPGAGKSAFIAQLASDHPSWLRYFIRRDQRSSMDVGVRSFLLKIGFQLAALKPGLFDRDQIELVVDQHIGEVTQKGSVVAAEVKKILSSPFHHAIIKIRQTIEKSRGDITGLRIGEWIADPLLLEISDLQNMAIFGPARALEASCPDEKIVIMIDALDELRYHDQEDSTVLEWLINCQALPANIRFILTSRPPEGRVQSFLEKQARYINHLALDPDDPRIFKDLSQYVQRLAGEEKVRRALAFCHQNTETFCEKLLNKAEGNIGYLDAVARGIDRGLEKENGQELLRELMTLEHLPDHVQGLYAFFLHQIKNHVADRKVAVEDPRTGETIFLNSWPAVYMRILAVLAVSFEPLTLDQIVQLGRIKPERAEVVEAMEWLFQFLDRFDTRFALYHATIAEFLTSPNTLEQPHLTDLYVDAHNTHKQMALNSLQRYKDRWPVCGDPYALKYTPLHFIQALAGGPEREDLAAHLATLLFDMDFDCRKADLFGVDALIADLTLALRRNCIPEEAAASDLTALKETLDLEAHNFRGWNSEDYKSHFLKDLYNRAAATGRRTLRSRLQKDLDKISPPYIIVDWRIGRESPNLLRTLPGHRNHITALSPAADDKYLLSGDDSGLIKLWNLQTGQEVRSLEGHGSTISGLATLDDKRVVSTSGDGTIRVWDIDSGKVVHKWELQEDVVKSLCLTSDCKYAVLVCVDGPILAYDMDRWSMLWKIDNQGTRLTAGCLTSDDQCIVTGGFDRMMRVWDLKSGDPVGAVPCNEITVLCAIPNRNWVVAGKFGGILEIWDWEHLERIKTLSGLPRGVTGVAITADGRYAVAGSWSPYQYDYVSAFDDSIVKIWSIEQGEEVQVLSSHTAGISAVATSNDSRLVISGAADCTVKIWKIKPDQQPLTKPAHNGPVKALAATADGRFVSGSADGTVKVWDQDAAKEYFTLTGHQGEVNCISISPDGCYALTGGHSGPVLLWDLYKGQLVQTFTGHSYRVYGVAFLPGGQRAVSAGADSTIRIWDIESGDEIQQFQDIESGWIFSLAITSDGRFAAAGCSQGQLQIWDLLDGKQHRPLFMEGGNIEVLATTHDDQILAHVQGGGISWIDLKSGARLKHINLNQNEVVRGIGVCDDGRNAVALTWKTVILFDIYSGEVITRSHLDGSLRSLCMVPSSEKIIVGDSGGNIYRLRCTL